MTSAATGKALPIGLRGALRAATYTLELIVIATAYFGLAVSGLLVLWINPTATPLWPPTGLALALVLIRGYRIWPAILVGGFFSTAVDGGALSEAVCIALGTPIAALAGAWLINRWSHGRETFATPLGVAKFALMAFVPTAMISATMATVGLVLANDVGLASPVATWTARWLADASGTLIIAPVIVLWATKPSRAWSRWRLLETAGVIIVTAAIGIAAFSPQAGSALMDSDLDALLHYRSLFAFLVVLPLSWASLRGNPRDAAAAALVFCALAAWGFATSFDLNGSPVLLFALALAVAVPPLVLAAAVATHQQTTARLQSAHDQLNRQVDRDHARVRAIQAPFPNPDRRRRRPRRFPARPLGTGGELELDRAADHRLHLRRNHRQAFRRVLPARRAALGRAEPRARTGRQKRQARRRGMAHQKERHAVLRHRHDHGRSTTTTAI